MMSNGGGAYRSQWILGLIGRGAILALSSCGFVTPELQENPWDKVSGQQMIDSISYNVECEIRDAVDQIYNNPDHRRQSTFLDTWGIQAALSLQVEEKSGISPLINWLPPSPPTAIFNFLFGGTVSGDATRHDKLNAYMTVQQIRALGPCASNSRPGGILLMQSDLGLKEWLTDNVTESDTGRIQYALDYSDGPLKTNVISHEIKFDVTTSGNMTPGWKLTRFLINQSGNFLSLSRDRLNDLIITLGPTVPTPVTKKNAQGQLVTTTSYAPSTPAANADLASQIGLAVSNALRGTLPPQP